MLEFRTTAIKLVPTFTDKEGNAIMFEPVKQEDGTYLLIGKMSTDIKENINAQD